MRLGAPARGEALRVGRMCRSRRLRVRRAAGESWVDCLPRAASRARPTWVAARLSPSEAAHSTPELCGPPSPSEAAHPTTELCGTPSASEAAHAARGLCYRLAAAS